MTDASRTDLSVIICTWNRAALLRQTLLSLRACVGLVPNMAVEVIVVDNNSKDDTRAVVEDLSAGWQTSQGRLCYAFEPRQGKQFALNTGIALSHGETLAFTDDDILFPPGWLAAVQAVFAASHVELAGGRTQLSWPEGKPPAWYHPSMTAILGGVDLGQQRLQPPPPGYAPAGANLVARRSLFERVGGFSELHFRHMDYEFGLRCTKAGAVLAYEPSMEVVAPVDVAMLSKRYFRRWSFKAGFPGGDETADAASFLAVPRWIYRRLLQDIVQLPLDALRSTAAHTFNRELRICRGCGAIASRWYAALWPERYPQWVAKYSQKKKNVY